MWKKKLRNVFRNQIFFYIDDLKRPQVIETRAVPRIGYALITAKTQVKIHFVQYLNFSEVLLN